MKNNHYAMLVSDIDGTLTDAAGQISLENQVAVRRLAASGVPVTLATGRTREAAREVVRALGIRLPVVLANGGELYDFSNEKSMYERRLQPDETVRGIALLQTTGLPVLADSDDEILVDKITEELEDYLFGSERQRVRVAALTASPTAAIQGPRKLCAIGTPGQCQQAYDDLKRATEGTGITVTLPDPRCIEILPSGVSKATGLAVLLRHLNLLPKELVAVGNAPNDLEMIRYAGLGIAVANAHPDLTAAADHVTTGNDQDAVANVVHHLFPAEAPVETAPSRLWFTQSNPATV